VVGNLGSGAIQALSGKFSTKLFTGLVLPNWILQSHSKDHPDIFKYALLIGPTFKTRIKAPCTKR
jgi:hypothetical protein